MCVEITDEHRKTLAQIEVLQGLDFPKAQLESTVVSLLQWIYKDYEYSEEKVISYLESMNDLRNRLSK